MLSGKQPAVFDFGTMLNDIFDTTNCGQVSSRLNGVAVRLAAILDSIFAEYRDSEHCHRRDMARAQCWALSDIGDDLTGQTVALPDIRRQGPVDMAMRSQNDDNCWRTVHCMVELCMTSHDEVDEPHIGDAIWVECCARNSLDAGDKARWA